MLEGVREIALIDPYEVRFSQNSVKRYFRDGGTIDELAEALRTGRTRAQDVPPIRLVERGGLLFTLDNRRPTAFRRARRDVPSRTATPEEVEAEQWKFTTTNNDTSIVVREAQG